MADPVRPRAGQKRGMTVRSSAGSPDANAVTGRAAKLDPDLQAHIGRQLRSLYDEVLQEPVPDHLRDLLQQLGHKPTDES